MGTRKERSLTTNARGGGLSTDVNSLIVNRKNVIFSRDRKKPLAGASCDREKWSDPSYHLGQRTPHRRKALSYSGRSTAGYIADRVAVTSLKDSAMPSRTTSRVATVSAQQQSPTTKNSSHFLQVRVCFETLPSPGGDFGAVVSLPEDSEACAVFVELMKRFKHARFAVVIMETEVLVRLCSRSTRASGEHARERPDRVWSSLSAPTVFANRSI